MVKKSDLKSFMTEAVKIERERRSSCRMCRQPEANSDLQDFLRMKSEGADVSLKYYWRNRLQPLFGVEVSYHAVANHVRACLQINARTGLPINGQKAK